MTISTLLKQPRLYTATLILLLSGMILFSACGSSETQEQEADVVEVTATHNAEENKHLYEMSTHEFPMGWTTFEFSNASPYDHFFLIWKVPEEGLQALGENESLVDLWHRSITEPFQNAYDPYINGDIAFDEFTNNLVGTISETAPWFLDPGAQFMGGPGFTAAGATSATTVNLEPGRYVVECYVKNEEEIFHSYIGMLDQFTVTDETSDKMEPQPTHTVSISSEEGIQSDSVLSAGSHVFEIFYEDQTTYEHMQGHNVQLVKLSDKDDQDLLNELSVWMDWRQPGSLVNRAPEGAEFMGGSMEMPQGQTAYFHADLQPGDYAWIAEVPNPAEHDMLKTFTIPGEPNSGD
ncbi:MAG: hypothetical protein R3222_01430 [Balneolaceae bacterium]|nr:hypothetical protein [Balneolaceae bacterium]